MRKRITLRRKTHRKQVSEVIIRAFRRSHMNIEALFSDPLMVAQVFFFNEISTIFHSVRAGVTNDHQIDIFPFFIRSYSYWESAARLWASGRIPETYCLLRASLESMSYAFVLQEGTAKTEKTQGETITIEDWMMRDQNESSHRRKFTWGNISEGLPNDIRGYIRDQYRECISWGAHPNPDAVNCGKEDVNGINRVIYQGATMKIMLRSSLSVIMTGILCLETFSRLYKETFEDRKATDKTKKLTQDFQDYINNLTANLDTEMKKFEGN